MEEEFVTYKIAEELKDLGFNLPCIAMFKENKKLWFAKKNKWLQNYNTDVDEDTLQLCITNYPFMVYSLPNGKQVLRKCANITAPLWQQAIKWLRTLDLWIWVEDDQELDDDDPFFRYIIKDWTADSLMSSYTYGPTEVHHDDAREKAILTAISRYKKRYNL